MVTFLYLKLLRFQFVLSNNLFWLLSILYRFLPLRISISLLVITYFLMGALISSRLKTKLMVSYGYSFKNTSSFQVAKYLFNVANVYQCCMRHFSYFMCIHDNIHFYLYKAKNDQINLTVLLETYGQYKYISHLPLCRLLMLKLVQLSS